MSPQLLQLPAAHNASGLTPIVSLGAQKHLLRLREDKSLRTHSECVTNYLKLGF